MFRRTLAKMVSKKAETLLEEDPLWWVLENVLFEKEWQDGNELEHGMSIEPTRTTEELSPFFCETADELSVLHEFKNGYSSAKSLGKQLIKKRGELERRITVECRAGRSRSKFWGFSREE